MIRISTQPNGDQTVISIDGRPTESHLTEIRRVRKAVKGAVVLSLRSLDTCSPICIRLLRDWLDGGARLQDATPFLEMALKDART